MPAMQSGGAGGTATTVEVTLGEMYVRPSVESVPAGEVTFVARNVGKVEHELMVEPKPLKFDSPGQPTEDAAMGMIEEMGPMAHGRMTLDMMPGEYELFCNVPGHYASGQTVDFTVTSG